jgi:hypothetical protein
MAFKEGFTEAEMKKQQRDQTAITSGRLLVKLLKE